MAVIRQRDLDQLDLSLLQGAIVTETQTSWYDYVAFDLGNGQSGKMAGDFTAFDENGFPVAGSFWQLILSTTDADLNVLISRSDPFSLSAFTDYVASGDTSGFIADMLTGNDQVSGSGILRGLTGNDLIEVREPLRAEGGDGNDIFRVRLETVAGGTVLVGGDGIDTLEVSLGRFGTEGFPAFASIDLITFSGIERLAMLPSSSGHNNIHLTFAQVNAFSIISGADGKDMILATLPFGGGGFNLKSFNLPNWTAEDTLGIVVGDGLGDYTLNASFHAAGTYLLGGGAGNDNLFGSNQADILHGHGGNDLLIGGGGNDVLDGGDGFDTASYAQAVSGVALRLSAPIAQDTVGAGTDTIRDIENVIGSAHEDFFIGTADANILDGRGGADILRGLGGDDLYLVDDAGDRVQEAAGGGMDEVRASVSFNLGPNVEKLVLLGGANLNGFGNALDNVLIGNGGDNILNGADGMTGSLAAPERIGWSAGSAAMCLLPGTTRWAMPSCS